MSIDHIAAAADARQITRAVVAYATADGTLHVRLAPGERPRPCDALHPGAGPSRSYEQGDEVLVWFDGDASTRGVVLGRVAPAAVARPEETPDELVLEAKEQLTLRVGDGSITLRADGKIQIKGKDLISHAQRLNRIKGGAVSIN
ncbi:hypothetical protein J421_5454 (plasmid) [Gemmatirosa kalamazoonensis]|uniref:Gp5/Type VI secretion system Vgr protein OB-fold domain-containing protein n=1 Tax=Gemmatirosa kalamazoonensis TaxID=861299 RepID=W0RPQ5_9BACT|nr:hypothetical protein [Gemmatirosa kalamazoonensis]AHG92989.1 hypothetical protein J421_5454 [Gemmatirosa kalamazoonensis]